MRLHSDGVILSEAKDLWVTLLLTSIANGLARDAHRTPSGPRARRPVVYQSFLRNGALTRGETACGAAQVSG